MFTLHENFHAAYGMCLWTVLAVIVFAIIVLLAIIHLTMNKKRQAASDAEIREMNDNSLEKAGEQI